MKPKDPEKIQSIYKATLALVGQYGLTGLTMAAIGKEAGIGMGTLYTYFESKEALINSLFKHIKGGHTERIFSGMNMADPYPLIVRKVLLSYLKNRIEHHQEHFFLEQALGSHFLDPDAQALGEAAYHALFDLLDRGKTEHLIKPMPNTLLAANLVGSANELANLVLAGQAHLDQQFADDAFTLCWDSIKR
jgi:TetR/AcrR family transcriptional regulator, repressor of fatR-cypB operon